MKYFIVGFLLSASLLACNKKENVKEVASVNDATKESKVSNDSLAVVALEVKFKALKPMDIETFKGKFPKELAGFKLTEVNAFYDAETGAYATANYLKGDQNVYLMVTDAAGVGASKVTADLINFLEIKKDEQPGDLLNIKSYKGHMAYFDNSMFKSDGMSNIQYLEADRFLIVASGNKINVSDLQAFLDNVKL